MEDKQILQSNRRKKADDHYHQYKNKEVKIAELRTRKSAPDMKCEVFIEMIESASEQQSELDQQNEDEFFDQEKMLSKSVYMRQVFTQNTSIVPIAAAQIMTDYDQSETSQVNLLRY